MSTLPTIPVFKPLLETEEKAAAERSLDDGWLGMGKSVGAFEQSLQTLIETPDRNVVAVATGHAALHLALLLVGVGPGDEVLTPSFNNIADFQAILATGASVAFCDIRDDTLCIDLEKADSVVSPRTKAFVAMDYGCHLCDHAAVSAFADRHGLRVIHDAAHSIGSADRGRPVGSFSDITMFSFDPIKTITAIDGGALIVKTDHERTALHEMRLIGMGQPASVMYQNQRAWTYDVRRLGFRYHMANLHAAIGLAQLGKFDRIRTSRRATFDLYEKAFCDLTFLRTPGTLAADLVPFLYYVRAQDGARDAFRAHLADCGIDTGIHWQPGHGFSLFREARRGDLSVTERVAQEIVTLPFHSDMADADAARVVAAVRSFTG